ncbi:hypothetical protein KIPB_007162 [Kipferlia bialata]|uniref:E2F/DP family winged-helix DNA-binding domain-containing protein n=1 Tax=Kipferlia bialata TaxID=797122 RepID=A0A9K3CSM6_9EUKA|nr:hypothetical protein KIPB_002680 [Kipferlia bialata]GIQ85488.1 hypothetical protein KIPB_007162 [Kipferlia bialata]|eukprot:g2680.t1
MDRGGMRSVDSSPALVGEREREHTVLDTPSLSTEGDGCIVAGITSPSIMQPLPASPVRLGLSLSPSGTESGAGVPVLGAQVDEVLEPISLGGDGVLDLQGMDTYPSVEIGALDTLGEGMREKRGWGATTTEAGSNSLVGGDMLQSQGMFGDAGQLASEGRASPEPERGKRRARGQKIRAPFPPSSGSDSPSHSQSEGQKAGAGLPAIPLSASVKQEPSVVTPVERTGRSSADPAYIPGSPGSPSPVAAKKAHPKRHPKRGTGSVVPVVRKPVAVQKRRGEGLEAVTRRIIALMQVNGPMTFDDIHNKCGVDHRRLYDIGNVLMTTPAVTKQGKRRDTKQPFIWGDGRPLPEPVPLETLMFDVEAEQRRIVRGLHELAKLRECRSTGVGPEDTTEQVRATGQDVDEAMDKAVAKFSEPFSDKPVKRTGKK